jgi:hypothetical protein
LSLGVSAEEQDLQHAGGGLAEFGAVADISILDNTVPAAVFLAIVAVLASIDHIVSAFVTIHRDNLLRFYAFRKVIFVESAIPSIDDFAGGLIASFGIRGGNWVVLAFLLSP